MALVVGVDSSTSACKLEIRDADTGEIVASGRAPHPPANPPRSEQEPASWLDAFESAGAQAGIGSRHVPAAVSVAAQQHGLVVSDVEGRVLRPAKLWNDTESAPDAAWLLGALPGGASAWAAACGSVPLAAFTIAKLSWLHRSEPELFRKVASVQLPHDWLTAQMTGSSTTDRGDASGTGYWSPAEERYRYDLLSVVDGETAWEDMLPEVLSPTEQAGTWREGGAVVAPGTGDNMAAALGIGLRPGDLAISLGTSGTAFALTERPASDASGAVAGFADATGRYLPLVCTLNATRVTDSVRRLLGVGNAEFDAMALASPAGSNGTVLVPYLDGERTPDLPGAKGLLTGIRADATREHLARAAFEGVVCNLLAAADRLSQWVTPAGDARIVLVGGGANSSAYRQLVADLSGGCVVVPDSVDLVARGAALQAAAVLTGASLDEVSRAWAPVPSVIVEPDPTVDRAAVREAYAKAAALLSDTGIPHVA
jgi:xylulokinase